MSTDTKPKRLMGVGDVTAKAMLFRSPLNKDHYYLAVAPDFHLDTLELWDRYGHDVKQATPVNVDDWEKKFWMVYIEDCFDPPVAIVRADNECDAQEKFIDELPWAHITDPNDLKDYDEETLTYNSNGVPCDTEAVMIRGPLKLLRIDVEFPPKKEGK